MFSPRRCCFGTPLTLFRNAHVHAATECNYYKTLGLNPSASQAEIKAAYYELSKKHHPDRNHGSEESAKIFRLVKAAYEVLGNEKRRMQYDKDMIFRTVRKPVSTPRTDNGPDYKDEAERIHYQSRTRPPFRRYSYGKTSYYDFDAWFNGHYGKNNYGFQQREAREPRQFSYTYHYKATDADIKLQTKFKNFVVLFFYVVLLLCTVKIKKVNKKD